MLESSTSTRNAVARDFIFSAFFLSVNCGSRATRYDQVHSRYGLNVLPCKLTPCKGCPALGLDIWPGCFMHSSSPEKYCITGAYRIRMHQFWAFTLLVLFSPSLPNTSNFKVASVSLAHRRGFVYMAFLVLAARSHSDHTRRRINRRHSDHRLWCTVTSCKPGSSTIYYWPIFANCPPFSNGGEL
jgi:hypothetical protein